MLLKLLDDKRNDIFVHIDAKSDFPIDSLSDSVKYSSLVIIDRIPIYWAEYSQVEAELKLLDAAFNSERKYSYYHLLSGMDLPLKTQDQIHDFFESETREFIATAPGEGAYQLNHVRYSYPLLRLSAFRHSKMLKALNEVLVLGQKMLHINRTKEFENGGWHFYDGWTWFSITDDFVQYVLENKELIK